MNIVPRYNYPSGTEVTLFTEKMALNRLTEDGYEFTNSETGATSVVPFSKFVEYLKSPAMRIENASGISSSVVELRLGGLRVAEQLTKDQREFGNFHFALCCAMDALRKKRRQELGERGGYLSIRDMDDRANREFIRPIAQNILGKKILNTKPRGGKSDAFFMYAGRTLIKYLSIFDSLELEDDAIAALAPMHHLKGNETERIKLRLRELMTQAWEDVGLDLKGPSVANVHKQLTTLVNEENQRRRRNELEPLIAPSHKTLKAHCEDLLSPSEYLLATKGERFTRNKRGRGSSDIRALMPGELVEIDECKASLITSAKNKGYWHTLATEEKDALKEIDDDIRSRLSILVMIDVASRMPLAWIVSDQPRAEATLALLRLATRDKVREKTVYGCEGDPTPAMGLGMVKNDNGVGLRNTRVKQALLGSATAVTDARTYASGDTPYIERMFGTTESVLLKLIHGYTGRRPKELPGYDASASGVLDIDALNGILTRFFIDEYPSMRHMGVGMGGRRPAEVFKTLNDTRGLFRMMDEDLRRVHLGWKVEVTPNDEGVRVFSGLWFNSDLLQRHVDGIRRKKIAVFVDPDNINEATVIIPGVKDLVRVQLQITAFADLTLPQVLELMAAYIKEEPTLTEIHDDRLAKTRRQRFDQLKAIGVEHRLPRSYTTFEECKRKAKVVFAGSRIIPSPKIIDTVRPGEITDAKSGPGIFQIGEGGAVIEHEAQDRHSETNTQPIHQKPKADARAVPTGDQAEENSTDEKQRPLGRPKTGGKFL